MFPLPYLQKYKGTSTRSTCPECGRKHSFTLYLDGITHLPINHKVGICNRESKCGYHYPPKQFFDDHPSTASTDEASLDSNIKSSQIPRMQLHLSSSIPSKKNDIGLIPLSYVHRSASYKSNFIRFLSEILTEEQITTIGENYALGATKNEEVIYWQIDTEGKVRTGKIMQYNPITGKRLKHESGAIDWVHNKLKKSGNLPEEFNLQQCFFGEHLLTLYPYKTVAIVESEKSALIASAVFPNLVWLAAGNLNGLSIDKCQVLQNRTLILYPDLNAFDKWNEKAIQIEKECNCTITVSRLLEDIATPEAKAIGLDIADFMIEQLRKNVNEKPSLRPSIQSIYTPELEAMIEQNSAIKTLIHKLQLEEV